MGQVRDRIPWWLTMIVVWTIVVLAIVGVVAGSVWAIAWLVSL